jgi:hypothetical protein
MLGERYVVVTVECSHCETKQKVHVALSGGATQMADERIQCLQCDKYFKFLLPDKILRGPFPT